MILKKDRYESHLFFLKYWYVKPSVMILTLLAGESLFAFYPQKKNVCSLIFCIVLSMQKKHPVRAHVILKSKCILFMVIIW